jgi:HK97 family phage prohead protease
MTHTFILSTEGINSYGFRVLTAGIRTTTFLGNPVMLWMHDRARLPIGRWENLRMDNGQLLGDAVFDENDPFAKTIADKVKNGFIRACSIGFHVLTVSVDKKDLMEGQKGATVTSCELMEISMVDIPSNKGCISLYDASGELITLKAGELNTIIPLVPVAQPKRQQLNNNTMDITTLASQLHLPTTATLAEVTAEIVRLQSAVQGYEAVEATRKVAERDTLLNEAIKSGKLSAADITHWHELFAANENAAKKVLAGTPAPVKLSSLPNVGAAATVPQGLTHNGKTFKELTQGDGKELAALKEDNFALFKRLYETSYGVKWKGN